jgi:alpha-galactosidase
LSIKISLIGAGSAVFCLGLIRDICSTKTLGGSTVSFMDIDEERLNSSFQLCQRYADEVNLKLNLEKTTNRKKSLKNADFVINTALQIGNDKLMDAWKVALKNGYRFGESLHILHDEAFWVNYYQLNLMESILVDMLELNSKAWYLLVANPVMAGITYLKRKYKDANIVGLCHGFNGVYDLTTILNLEREYITYEVPGVNHFLWLTNLNYKGEDVFPLLDNWIENKSKDYFSRSNSHLYGFCPKTVDLYKRFGAFPIGDTGTPGGGSWGWWYHTDDETEANWKENPKGWWYDYHFPRCEKEVKEIRKLHNDLSIRVTDKFPIKHSGDLMIPIIESIAFDIPKVEVVNVLNDGEYIEGIPKNFEVEVPALVSKNGIQPIKTNGLPKQIISYILGDMVAPVEMELAAFEERSRELLLNLVMMDPWTKSEKQANKLIDEIFSLPYHEKVKQYYK